MEQFKTKTQTIFYFLRGAKKYFFLSILCAMCVSFLEMINPRIISFTVDSVIGQKEAAGAGFTAWAVKAAGGIGRLRENPWLLALAVGIVGIAAAAARYGFRVSNAKGAELFVRRTRDELYGHIIYLPYTWLGQNSTGDIIQRCTSDVQTIKRFVAEQLTSLVRTIIMMSLAISFMWRINLQVMLTCVAFIPIILGYSFFFHAKIGSAFSKADIEEGKLSTIAQENLTGVRVVRAFGREQYERERFEKQNAGYTAYWIHLIRLLSIFWCSGDLIMGVQMLSVTMMGSYMCVKGSLTAGDMIALISYTVMLGWPVRMLGRVIAEMSKAGISIDRLRYIMNSRMEEDHTLEPAQPFRNGEIAFDHVSFSYGEGSPDVLEDVSFRIPASTTVGILGGTGSGKSTLMYLLERLYDIEEGNGKITISGTDIRQIPLADLRSHVGIVLQEPYLLSRTLSENIGITARQTDLQGVRRAAKAACIDDAIESFTDGYDTFVGERGVTLSGGQKQRTAIAQLLLRQTPVMIFDDSLSAVDSETDAKIRKALKEYSGSATVILIAHRITTLMHADQILVLDKGRIVQKGTHRELLAQDGMYRKIYDLQAAGIE